jgi:SHS2 domain-containing protein
MDEQAMKGFEIVEHTADWALRIVGRDLTQLFRHAAQGMSTLLVADVLAIGLNEERQIALEAYDAESLLVAWLGELAYWAEVEQLVFRQFDLVPVTPTHLQATVRGGRAAELQKHIKAVTYHNLNIIQGEAGLEATVVFDV